MLYVQVWYWQIFYSIVRDGITGTRGWGKKFLMFVVYAKFDCSALLNELDVGTVIALELYGGCIGSLLAVSHAIVCVRLFTV